MEAGTYWPGTYFCSLTEDMLEYSLNRGNGFVISTVLASKRPQLDISLDKESGTWRFAFKNPLDENILEFKLNEVVHDVKTYDEQKCSMVVVKDETTNGIIMTQTPSEGPEVVVKVQKEFHNGLTFELSSHGKKAIVKFLSSPDVQSYHFSPMEEELHTPDEMDALEEKMRQFVIE